MVFFINSITTLINQDVDLIVSQTSYDWISLFLPVLGVLVGIFVSVVGLKRFENIDKSFEDMRASLESKIEETIRTATDQAKEGTARKIREAVDEHAEEVRSDISRMTVSLREDIDGFIRDYGWLQEHRDYLDELKETNVAMAAEFVEEQLGSAKPDVRATMNIVEAVVRSEHITGDAADYHNLASVLGRHDYFDKAALVAEKAVEERFPADVDLLSDVVHFNCKIGQTKKAKDAVDTLNKIPLQYWNWRAFRFVIDYYNSLPASQENQCSALNLVAQYHEILPDDEGAYAAEYKTLTKYGRHPEALQALKAAMSLRMAPQCAMELADHYLGTGEFSLAVETATRAIIGNASDQESVDTGAIFACRGLAKDAIIYGKLLKGTNKESLEADIRDAIDDLLMSQVLGFIQKNIRHRIVMLKRLLTDTNGDLNSGNEDP